ncbi:unnamed protein product [Moneuplotes crassus]|uniref:Uncharacterized protein n=1 Tax=Euplotes crassus TaxID=5936 RepID=A0AAD1XKC6_EUPCR|nr:unnamed protein product [Moneuplotes crassus]
MSDKQATFEYQPPENEEKKQVRRLGLYDQRARALENHHYFSQEYYE